MELEQKDEDREWELEMEFSAKQHQNMVEMIRQDTEDLYQGKLDAVAAKMTQTAIRELSILRSN